MSDCSDLDDPPTWLYMRITEHQARELLANRVDDELKAMARVMVDWQWELAQKAARPVPQPRSRKRA
jgi:hypothetical protein